MKKDHGDRSCSKQEQSKGFFFIQLFSKYKVRKSGKEESYCCCHCGIRFLIPHFAKIDVTPAKNADPAAYKSHIQIPSLK